MIGGVNFQPGSYQNGENGQNGQARPGGSGVQEAIRILSLRLPKVVGAQAISPMALLTSQGSGGNRVDSVVNQVLSRLMPEQRPQAMGGFTPQVVGDRGGQSSPMPMPNARGPEMPYVPPPMSAPRVSPIERGGGMPSTPSTPSGPVYTTPPPPRRIDYTQPDRPLPMPTPVAPPPTNPWDHLSSMMGNFPSGVPDYEPPLF